MGNKLKEKRILIVDDEPDVIETLEEFWKEFEKGFRVSRNETADIL